MDNAIQKLREKIGELSDAEIIEVFEMDMQERAYWDTKEMDNERAEQVLKNIKNIKK